MNRRGVMLDQPTTGGDEALEQLARQITTATVVRRDEPLARHTTLRVGGPADLYVEPASDEDLAEVLACCRAHGRQVLLIGRGSNLLVKDGGFRGVVICLAHPHFSRIEVLGERLRCGAGARLKSVAAEAKRNSLTGFEFLEGIPGRLGGALRMNAGAMGGAIFDLVESVRLMGFDGRVQDRTADQLGSTYRSCAGLKDHIALAAVLRGHPGQREAIEQKMKGYSRKRWQAQPAAPSAGCIFKNPAAIPAGRLIEELGLKGARVGGAVVSAEHGNFIVNDGAASARNILDLIEVIRQRARVERGIDLETEVQIVGE